VLAAELRSAVPPGQRILALHRYWFGFEDTDFRSFLVPLNWADEGLPLDQGLSRVAPGVVILDSRLRDYFDEPSVAGDRDRLYTWLGDHSARMVGRVDDPTYGLFEIFEVGSS
jgi:hypothetical protein